MLRAFKEDKFFFLKENAKLIAIYCLVIFTFFALGSSHFETLNSDGIWLYIPILLVAFVHAGVNILGLIGGALYMWHQGVISFHYLDVFIMIVGALFGTQSGAYMHNASHGNCLNKFVSDIVGYLGAFHQGVGYKDWKLVHTYHHVYADDPVMDPHPPLDNPFFKFYINMKFNVGFKLEHYYLTNFGATKENKILWNLTGLVMLIAAICTTLIWFLLLGPKYFIIFYGVSKAVVDYFYAHFNYYTHQKNDKNEYVPVNRNEGIFKVFNFLGEGAYYHELHHKKPYLYNPLKAAKNQQQKYKKLHILNN